MNSDSRQPFQEYFFYFLVRRDRVGYVCSTIESYPHIAKVSSIQDGHGDLLECIVPGGFLDEFREVINRLKTEGVPIREIKKPEA